MSNKKLIFSKANGDIINTIEDVTEVESLIFINSNVYFFGNKTFDRKSVVYRHATNEILIIVERG